MASRRSAFPLMIVVLALLASLAACGGSKRPTVRSIAVTPNTMSVALGLTQQFTATATMTDNTTQNVTATAQWSSSSTAVASIAAGLATTLTQGTTTISATAGGKTGSAALTVAPPAIVSITVTLQSPTMYVGAMEAVWANATMTDRTNQDVTQTATWESSHPSVALPHGGSPGLPWIQGCAEGTATISASLGGKSDSAPLTVHLPTSFAFVLNGPWTKTYGVTAGHDMGHLHLITSSDPASSMVSDGLGVIHFYIAESPYEDPYIWHWFFDVRAGEITDWPHFNLSTGTANSLALEPAHKWLYAWDDSDPAHPALRTFALASDGRISSIAGSLDLTAWPWAVPVSNQNTAFLKNTHGTFFYWGGYDPLAANYMQLFAYVLNPDTGELGQQWDSPFTGPATQTYSMAISSDGLWLYHALADYRISVWSLDQVNGIPTYVWKDWGPGGGEPIRAMVAKQGAAYFYASQAHDVLQLTNDGTGNLSLTATTTVPDDVQALALDDANSLLYVGDSTGISAYTISAGGALTLINRVTLTNPGAVQIAVLSNPSP